MRYKLVPKQISEEHFWRNYFYRVSLVKKLLLDKKKENAIVEDFHPECSQPNDVSLSAQSDNNPNAEVSSPVSDADQKSSLTGKQGSNTDEDWEKELLSNLDEFELVENGGKSEVEWDQESMRFYNLKLA
uniref:BSD domain-containing protein n=1 Tax=Ditylenchus dipsaci TaxID=166011 RepID=A0A915DPI7_9BILA